MKAKSRFNNAPEEPRPAHSPLLWSGKLVFEPAEKPTNARTPLSRNILANVKDAGPDLNTVSIPDAGYGLYDLNVTLIHRVRVTSRL